MVTRSDPSPRSSVAGLVRRATRPRGFRALWAERATRALADVRPSSGVLTEADLAGLPAPLAAYVRRSGALGRPRVTSLGATFHGRIRSAPDHAWMPFTARQVSTFGARPQRVFLMDATRSGLPVTVLHDFDDATATMRARLLSLVPVVDAAGPEMDRGETVTVLNDLVVLAPGAVPGAPVRWTEVDDRHVHGTFRCGDQTVSATLTFDAQHDLVDFTSDDRFRAAADGRSFTPQRWSTPVLEHQERDGRRLLAAGEGWWHPPEPGPAFAYVELRLDELTYDLRGPDDVAALARRRAARRRLGAAGPGVGGDRARR